MTRSFLCWASCGASLILLGCAQDNRTRVREFDDKTRPGWVDAPPLPDAESVYAVGVARERMSGEEAEDVAFVDACAKIAASVNVDVSHEISRRNQTTGASGTNQFGASTSGRSETNTETSAAAHQVLSGTTRVQVFRQKVEIDPPRIAAVHVGSRQENHRWDAYVLVSFPRSKLDLLVRSVSRGVSDPEDLRSAVEAVSSSDEEERGRAIRTLESIAAANPRRFDYRFELGSAYVRVGRTEEARAVFEGLVQCPDDAIANLARGRLRAMNADDPKPKSNESKRPSRLEVDLVVPKDASAKSCVATVEEELTRGGAVRAAGGGVLSIQEVERGPTKQVRDLTGESFVLHGTQSCTVRWESDRVITSAHIQVNDWGVDASVLDERLERKLARRVIEWLESIGT